MTKFVLIRWLGWSSQYRYAFSQIGRKFATYLGHLTRMFILLSLFLLPLSIFLLKHFIPGVAASNSEVLWGISQKCDSEIDHRRNSTDGPRRGFDGRTASCPLSSGHGGNIWSYTEFERSSLVNLQSLSLQISFFVSDWDDQDIFLAIFQLDQLLERVRSLSIIKRYQARQSDQTLCRIKTDVADSKQTH